MTQYDPKFQGRINRAKNIPFFKEMSEAEIADHLLRKDEEKKGLLAEARSNKTNSYEDRYNKLLTELRTEFAVDMNASNDAEALKNLVRHTLQLESINDQIRDMQEEGMSFDDTRAYKNLADIQRSLIMSITDLQNSLGVSRKARKEKSVDDIPQFIDGLKKKAAEFWQRKTTPIMCNKCEIELARNWLNFPNQKNRITFELECWKCHEQTIFIMG